MLGQCALLYFFFFQAEDGIRDLTVTGVQTCALPILLSQLGSDGWLFYQPLIAATLGEALRGYLIGNGLALACAALVLLVPWLERLVVQLAVASYCLPLVAIGPILSLLLTGDAPMITIAALSVFFTT